MATVTCHNIPPVKSDYEPIGVIEKFNDLDVYVSKPKDKSKPYKNAIIICYDVHGFHPNVKQFCDLLAEAGFLVALPDYFRGETTEVKSKGLVRYVFENFTNERIEKETLKVVEHLHSEYGVENLGFGGFCWGGFVGSKICTMKDFDACVLIHYAPIKQPEVFKDSQCPIAFLPSRDDHDSQPYIDAMKDKPFVEKCIQKRFDDMHHGFAGSRGNFSDELNSKRVNEAIEIAVKFYHDNLGVKY
ncbi:Alpha/Beta hydrolase protein [Glomus cerebriforme]|uniref:Alpha/Beta hydrolase protein n=1 Tax=Glomus cerebriforme TaxID=658196 RepID=A0A397T5U9_9GLOM|nr:Alpha/Beta hydrolase protein [Glomus cerebriforme]